MEQEKEIGNGIEDESESIKKGSEYCSGCSVLEDRCKKFESDLEAKINDIEELQRQIVVLQARNEVLLKSFPKGSDEKSSQTTIGDWDKCGVDLMEEVENDQVSDVGFRKAKCEELENELSDATSGTANVVVNPVIKTEVVKDDVATPTPTPLSHSLNGNARQVNIARRQLNYDEETRDKMAPTTPAAGVISNKRKRASCIWESQRDMVGAFIKDPVICMMAVCALYRKQTPKEKLCRETRDLNGRGFNKDDAMSGSILGEFLTDGDPEGGLNKSVEELTKFQPDGLEVCKKLAIYYSRQLFQMYENEDDLWP